MNWFSPIKRGTSLFLIMILMLSCINILPVSAQADELTASQQAHSSSTVPAGHLRIHYNGDYENHGVWLWEDVASPSKDWPSGALPFTTQQQDNYGAYVDVPLQDGAKKVGFLIVNRLTGEKEGGDKGVKITSSAMKEIWVQQGSDEVILYEPVTLPPDTVRIHYTREDQNYSTYGLWLWEDVATPSENWPTGALTFSSHQTDSYGAYLDVPLKDNAQKIGFLVVNTSNGDEKDGGDKNFHLLDRFNQLWIKEGDNQVYISPFGETAIGLVSADLVSTNKIILGFTMTDGLEAESLKDEIRITDKNDKAVQIDSIEITSKTTVEVAAAIDMEQLPLHVTYAGRTVTAAAGWKMLDELYYYEGDDLGATYKDGAVTLKLWAPLASSVTVNVYDKNDDTRWIGNRALTLGDQGVWSVTLTPQEYQADDLRGYYYQYEVTNHGVTKKVLDPYAKSMAEFRVDTTGKVGVDGDPVGKAAIVDLSTTNPDEFDYADIKGYEKREDAVIWEIHVRDFTSDPSIEGDLNARWGSYKAFQDKLEYIKSLGVTHVQLLPVMAWYYGDESAMGQRELEYSAKDNEYNWGYDPHNYFSPDGAYSENPADPELRIRELKELINAIHEAGMGVVLDVVYTHMAKADFLNDIVPGYYAWQDGNGNFIGGFGNNLATNHKMAEKLMVDSVAYWFDEYKIDGMRWDMMGDATYDSVQKAYDAAAAINPNALFIGEGWRTFAGDISDPSLTGMGADQDWMNKTDSVGVFSDEIRNELKSGFGSEGEPRFITGGARDVDVIFNNIKAQPSNTPADSPGDMVQYIEAHDNLTLYDVIAQSIKKDPAIPENDLEIHKRIRLGNLLVLTSQGTAFLHAGQEYGRTKQWKASGVPEHKYEGFEDVDGNVFGYFVHDSYDSSDAINHFDWTKAMNKDKYPVNVHTKEYTQGLIQLRQSTDAFRLGEQGLVNSNVTRIDAPEIEKVDLVIAYKNKATDGTGNYYVFVNADSKSRALTLSDDLTTGVVVVDQDEAGVDEVSSRTGFTLTSSSITLEPLTAVVIRQTDISAENPGSNPEAPTNPSVPSQLSPAIPSVPSVNVDSLQELAKLLKQLPQQEEGAVTSIITALQELGTVKNTIPKSEGGQSVVRVQSSELEAALNRMQAGWELVKSELKGREAHLAAIQSKLSVTIDLHTSALGDEELKLILPTAGLSKLNSAAVSLHLTTSDTAITWPPGTITSDQLKRVQHVMIVQSLRPQNLDVAMLAKKQLRMIGTAYHLGIFLQQQDQEEEAQLNNQISISIQQDGSAWSAVTDHRKAGIYELSDQGSALFKGGQRRGQAYTFNTKQPGVYGLMQSDYRFDDLVNSFAKEAAEILAARFILKDDIIEEGKFMPRAAMTRGELALQLGNVLGFVEEGGTTSFKDVSSDSDYAGMLEKLVAAGIISGYGDGTFRGEEALSREEMIAIVMNVYAYGSGQSLDDIAPAGLVTSFHDMDQITAYAQKSVLAAEALGFVNGVGKDAFAPQATANREQAAKVVFKLMEALGYFE